MLDDCIDSISDGAVEEVRVGKLVDRFSADGFEKCSIEQKCGKSVVAHVSGLWELLCKFLVELLCCECSFLPEYLRQIVFECLCLDGNGVGKCRYSDSTIYNEGNELCYILSLLVGWVRNVPAVWVIDDGCDVERFVWR